MIKVYLFFKRQTRFNMHWFASDVNFSNKDKTRTKLELRIKVVFKKLCNNSNYG